MARLPISARTVTAPQGGYAQAMQTRGAARWLHVSGQIPVAPDGAVPEGFAAQAVQVWTNLIAQLRAANMGIEHLVKVTTYLASRDHRDANAAIRRAHLGAHTPALTVIIATLYDPAWLLEIEAIAAD